MTSPLTVAAGRVAVRSSAVSGIARKGRRTKDLVKRLKRGDIAVIDHKDLDGLAAQGLADRRIAAVINAAQPISGRYPNRGPQILAAAGIPLFQMSDPDMFDLIPEGKGLTITAQLDLMTGTGPISGSLTAWTSADIQAAMDRARANLGRELEQFASNTLTYVRQEKALLIEPIDIPRLDGVRPLQDRQAVIVVRGEGYREDLLSIRSYIRDVRPVLIAVDGGADALIEAGLKPDIIIGDMDSVSDNSLRSGAKLIVHAYAHTGEAPGMIRIAGMGLKAETFPVAGTSEDAAMLLAFEKGARLIVAVGTHSNLEDFLDKGRAGMASTFLVRMRCGARLVDARGVSQIHRRSATKSEMAWLLLSGGFALWAVVSQSALLQSFALYSWNWLRLHLRFHHGF